MQSSLGKARILRNPDDGKPRRVRGDFQLEEIPHFQLEEMFTAVEFDVTMASERLARETPPRIEDAVRGFLVTHGPDLGLELEVSDLECLQDLPLPIGRVVRYRELRNGLPVHDTEIVVLMGQRQTVQQIELQHASDQAVVADFAEEPEIEADRALTLALREVGDPEVRARPWVAGRIFFPLAGGGLRPAYRILIPTQSPLHDWEVVVDAIDGSVLEREDLLETMPDGSGLVFDPNPVVAASDASLRDPDAEGHCELTPSSREAIDMLRVERPLRDLTVRGGTHHLEGPFVKIVDLEPPNASPPQEASPHDFRYSSGDPRFEAVNVYFHIDTVQRYLQALGIHSAHPFPVEAEVHADREGASHSPIDGRLRFGHSGPCRPNRGSDGDAILHEYGHAIQHSQVPGWGRRSQRTLRDETRAMGEGFGDILACVFFAEHGQGFQRENVEDWVFANTPEGALRQLGSAKIYPFDIQVGAGGHWTQNEHADGEIWSAVLWQIYRDLGGDSSDRRQRLDARDELLKTLILSHHCLKKDATMPEGAEAFMAVNRDLPEFRLRFGIQILERFHARGLLRCHPETDLQFEELWTQQDDESVRGPEDIQSGQDNWFYARIFNDGDWEARAVVVTFCFQVFCEEPAYPDDFRDRVISSTVDFNVFEGDIVIVKARWPAGLIPQLPDDQVRLSGCVLAEVHTPVDSVPQGVTRVADAEGKLKVHRVDII